MSVEKPTDRVKDNGQNPIVRASTYQIATAYLESLKVTMWPAKSWALKDDEGLDYAATWLTHIVDEINAVRNMAEGSTRSLYDITRDYRRMVEKETYHAHD